MEKDEFATWVEKTQPATQQVTHITLNSKYRVVFEQAASTKGVLGWKVEANGDDKDAVMLEAQQLMEYARARALQSEPCQPKGTV